MLAVLTFLSACDPQRVAELEEGLSTEADVRARFGEPEDTWDAPDGGHTLEYSRQPQGHRNYIITIGADGRMSALRQVLTPQKFALVVRGMTVQEVRRMLGKPMRVAQFERTRQTHYDWRYRDGPNATDARIFTVVLDADLRVVSTGSVSDAQTDRTEQR